MDADDYIDTEDKSEDDEMKTIRNRRLNDPQNIEINCLKPVIYRNYASVKNIKTHNLPLLLQYLRNHKEIGDIDLITFKTKVSRKTLLKWHENIQNDNEWSPLLIKRTKTHKAMDTLLEDSIMNYIYTKFLSKGFQFNDKMAKYIALMFWNQHPEHRIAKKFSALNNWIRRFKQKYGLTNRHCHYHRRPKVTQSTNEHCKVFYKEMKELYKKHKSNNTLHLLINVDETAWKLCFFGELTWAAKGSEHVEFSDDFNEKDNITVIAATSASNEYRKLPLFLIKKGKTERSTSSIKDVKKYFQIDTSETGWSTVACFAEYLLWLREELDARYKDIENYTNEQEIDIILDLYASHRNDKIKEIAEKLKFKLHYIPAGYTDLYQPLDRYVFGALKSMARSEFYAKYVIDPEQQKTLEEACKMLIECWGKISENAFLKAWNIYSNQEEIDMDSLIKRDEFKFNTDKDYLIIEEKQQESYEKDTDSESDSDYENESGIDYDVFNESTNITEDIVVQINKTNEYEKLLKSKTK